MKSVKVLICPNGSEEIVPVKVWESRLPDGKIIHYGQLCSHTHYGYGQECEWSCMVRPLIEREDVVPSIYT